MLLNGVICPMVMISADYWLILCIIDYWLASCSSTVISGRYLLHSAWSSGCPHDSLHYSYLSFLRSLLINCRSLDVTDHLFRIIIHTFCQHDIKDTYQLLDSYNCNMTKNRDMLPPLKSQILKWGLLAQWLYWAKYLQAILACPAILLPGHGHIFLFLYCPDTDSLYCQHPSCLFTEVDCCITISIHFISTRTVIDSFG